MGVGVGVDCSPEVVAPSARSQIFAAKARCTKRGRRRGHVAAVAATKTTAASVAGGGAGIGAAGAAMNPPRARLVTQHHASGQRARAGVNSTPQL